MPAKQERPAGTQDYAAHKMVWVPWTTPQLHQGWLKHMMEYKLLNNANYVELYLMLLFIILQMPYN
jgi:hypothetical protein